MAFDYDESRGMQQRDLTLAENEYCLLQSKTNGVIKTYSGPITMTISAQETLVYFDERTKTFKETNDFNKAKRVNVIIPESWYCILKNPAPSNEHPESAKAQPSPGLEIGKKVNILGADSFSLFPGQMARVIQGHRIRTNQYLIARVYDADALVGPKPASEETEIEDKLYNGKLLVIKGTNTPFYIPPTGIEVIPIDNNPQMGYVREAITLERLEYCILKDEDGNKEYKYGPDVVFPSPTQTFVESPKGGNIFKAIELSKITGVYVKVIASYDDENGTHHPVGEELFITGNEQMIYYPRPEHALISYDNKIVHHAIAIPEGEGRYVMNRLTGDITTVKGPSMYLPDPRTEVIVKRKLTDKQCDLWYPGNRTVKDYNASLNEKSVERMTKAADTDLLDAFNSVMCNSATSSTLAYLETNANISRGTSYTKPRTITLDNRYDGVVTIDVWAGYAVEVASKDGSREVVVGPQTVMLDYDQTLTEFSDCNKSSVFLKYTDNMVNVVANVITSDNIDASVTLKLNVNFNTARINDWFKTCDYIQTLSNKLTTDLKRVCRNYTLNDLYSSTEDCLNDIILNPDFNFENGMVISDFRIIELDFDHNLFAYLDEARDEKMQLQIDAQTAEAKLAYTNRLIEAQRAEFQAKQEQAEFEAQLESQKTLKKLQLQEMEAATNRACKKAEKEAEKDLLPLLEEINNAALARKKASIDLDLEREQNLTALKKAAMDSYANTVKTILSGMSDDLVAAMTSKSNADLTAAIASSLAPYALANEEESVADVVNKITRGTPLNDVLKTLTD